jgi:hypothetical protein
MKATLAVVFAIATLSVGCSSNDSAVPPPSTSQTSVAPTTGTPVSGLIGRWERVLTCQELVSELDGAGLRAIAQYAWSGQTSSTGEGSYAKGSPKPTEAHPCTGALPRQHSHFFNQSGQFGSLDWLGGQVDDAPYRIVNSNIVDIGSPPIEVTFHYRLLRANRLMLTPILTKAMIHQALADPKKFSAASWAVSVAYAGQSWQRVPCQSWC